MATAPLTCRHTMLLILALCVTVSCAAAAAAVSPSDALPENNNGGDRDVGPVDADEYGVRNYVSDHELPRDVPTRVKIVGDLGTPPPGVHVDFVPKQTYVQVRRYDAVKRLPQEEAANEASTSEELANASRLREVVTHKKTQEIYEEQGYEDAGYDHGGSKKLKVEEEVKDNQSEEVYKPKNDSLQNFEETNDHVATVAPSGRGTWSRHKTTTGKKTKYEEDGNNRKVTTNDNSPISEKWSGNYTKFDGGKTIVVQNLTETERKDFKRNGAESRRVASFSKTKDNIEPTTYRPTIRYDSPRHTAKPIKNERKQNRTRSRSRKRQEGEAQKPQADVIGSYDNSPWIPMSPPTDYTRPHFEGKKQVKSKMNSELYEPNGHSTRYGYTVNHNIPYQYVIPTDRLIPESSNKPNRKIKPIAESSDVVENKQKNSSYENHEFVPQTNYDGSAINSKQKKVKKTSEEDFPLDNINLHSNKYNEPTTQLKTDLNYNVKPNGRDSATQRPKNNLAQIGSSENVNSYIKSEPRREQKKTSHRGVEIELGSRGNSGSQYKLPTSTIDQDVGLPKNYEGPQFITKLKKHNFYGDSRGDPTLRIYPKYEIYPSLQNVKHPVNDETYNGKRILSNINKGHANFEINESPPRGTRLTEYSKFNNRPTNLKQSVSASENWENFSPTRSQTAKLQEENFPKFNKVDVYPRFESAGTKQSPIYRLVPYEKSVKINNPYSYVYYDDHYPSGSRYSGIKVEMTTQGPTFDQRKVYWNNRHPHLPKDSIKIISSRNKSEDENTRHVENLTLAHFSGVKSQRLGLHRPLPLEYNERVNNLAKLLNDNYPKRTRRDLEVIHIASSGTTTEIPIDTDVYPHYKKAPKQSALRYASNPVLAPRKTAGGMEFYASTSNIKCDDMSVPDDIVPKRTNDGEWKGEPSNNSPRVDAIGDKIGCFKTKYFGSDPLDNPIFKEKDVGFPDVLFSKKKPPEYKEIIQPGQPHVDWDFADELIPGNWFSDKDKRSRRSSNNSLSTNHTTQGMASILPEPVILTFSTEASTVVYVNKTKLDTDNSDSDASSNDKHILKYSIQHPTSKFDSSTGKNNIDEKIVGLYPPPQTTYKKKKIKKIKKPIVKKLLKKVKVDRSNEADLLDVLGPITSFFTNGNDDISAPIVHNFFNIKITPSAQLKTTTAVDKNSAKRIHLFQLQSNRRTKRNMKGIELQKPKLRELNFNTNSSVNLSSSTARVRMYSPKNGTWFREKRDHVSVNVDVRRKEPRYYDYTEMPRVRVKRVVHNPPFHSRSSQMFSSKYLVADQDKSESLPEEINVAFSTTPRSIHESTTKFIPAIAFGDSKTKILNLNDSVANSTNDIGRIPTNFDKKGSLIYVINPDNGHGKWMQVIKVKNEDDSKTAITNVPVYLEKKVKDVVAEESIGKFGFKGPKKDLFKNFLGPSIDHRFKVKPSSTEPIKLPKEPNESKQQPKKAECPKIKRPKKKEVKRRTTTTTSTTEIPVVEEVDDRPEEQSGEEENIGLPEDGEGGENEEEAPVERPYRYQQDQQDQQDQHEPHDQQDQNDQIDQNDQNDQNDQDQNEQQDQQESEENPDNVENHDQDVRESIRKKPFSPLRRPNFSGYLFG